MLTGVLKTRDGEYKYSLDVNEDELINIYIKELILYWCEKNHPDVVSKIESNIKELILKENEN
tara:strand:+ start:37809 stop:37997 length:189 start_codon:yes stop_codon:yes gene_type:complete